MPWQITLTITFVLFLVAPFFKNWVDRSIWPRFVDWWAERSISAIEAQIKMLEDEVKRDFTYNDLILRCWTRLFAVLATLTIVLTSGILTLGLRQHPTEDKLTEWLNSNAAFSVVFLAKMPLVVNVIAFLICLTTLGIPYFIAMDALRQVKRYRWLSTEEGIRNKREALNLRIETLKRKLDVMQNARGTPAV